MRWRATAGWLAVALLVLVGCRTSSSSSTPPSVRSAPAVAAPPRTPGSRRATIAELQVVQTLMRETEALRGLSFRAPVDVHVESRGGMRSFVLRAIDEPQLARARRRYIALGVLDPALDLQALLVSLMEEELIGYYDPREKRLAVRDDVARALGAHVGSTEEIAYRAIVVHELVHALQDQHFDLARLIAEERTTDADNALGALLEGDATLTMIAYGEARSGSSLQHLLAESNRLSERLTRAPEPPGAALQRAPALVREPLLFRYREGTTFCAALFRRGGWAAIDAAHLRPPETTRAIVHPARYPIGDLAAVIPTPTADFFAPLELTVADEDTLGALELGVLLGMSATMSHSWRSDRYVVLSRSSADASLWWLELASARAARAVAARFVVLGDPQRRVAQLGTRVLIGRALPQDAFDRAVAWTRARPRVAAPSRRRRGARASADTGVDPLATSADQH